MRSNTIQLTRYYTYTSSTKIITSAYKICTSIPHLFVYFQIYSLLFYSFFNTTTIQQVQFFQAEIENRNKPTKIVLMFIMA